MPRTDRAPDALRSHELTMDFVSTACGSCLIRTGGTRVICTASVEDGVPPFLRGKGEGWLTAEYAMLPASTGRRKQRDGIKKDGRGVEIGRLIGRALRQAVDLSRLGERTITVDCDVLEADGGTRTASITGGFAAVVMAVNRLITEDKLKESPVVHQIAAVSAGIVEGEPRLDLCYAEDSAADTDMNFVMDETGSFIELQGTGEGRAFTRGELAALLSLGEKGCAELLEAQREALGERALLIGQKRKLVLASNNEHKLKELRSLLEGRYEVLSMHEAGCDFEVEETGDTFVKNATLKAEAVMRATGLLSLADDSGLSVDALDGAPGVLSARFAGAEHDYKANNALLMERMQDVPDGKRGARFICCMALSSPFANTKTVTGSCEGVITREARGSNGFGYDPYFLFENGKTFAEHTEEEKNRVSHRANAVRAMMEYL